MLAVGEDDNDVHSVAVWQIGPEGHPTGAWVVDTSAAYGDPTVARRLLVGIERRALTTADPATLEDVVERLTATAGVDPVQWWKVRPP